MDVDVEMVSGNTYEHEYITTVVIEGGYLVLEGEVRFKIDDVRSFTATKGDR